MATILLLEDDAGARRAMERLLESDGHRVIAVENGWQGLGAMETAAVDLVVLDLELPGLDGVHFLRDGAWERRWERVPVIVVSGGEVDRGVWNHHRRRIRDWVVDGEGLVEAVRREVVGVN